MEWHPCKRAHAMRQGGFVRIGTKVYAPAANFAPIGMFWDLSILVKYGRLMNHIFDGAAGHVAGIRPRLRVHGA